MEDREVSRQIAGWLRRAGLNEFAGVALSAARPLAVIGAQAAYLLQPLFGRSSGRIGDLAGWMESTDRFDELIGDLLQDRKTK